VSDGLTVGAVMMAVRREKVLALEAAGYSDLTARKPMRTDAIFDIRSISKPITVLGALLLVDDGRLTRDDPLAKFLPEFSHLTVKGQTQSTDVPITLRELMMHASGIADERPSLVRLISRWQKTRRSLPNNRWISHPAASGPTAVPGLQFWAELSKWHGANGASGCILWIDPSIQLIRIYLTHCFLGSFREANPVRNAAFPG
jgi:CubicO group peptidase (beta-lactamase class C family)